MPTKTKEINEENKKKTTAKKATATKKKNTTAKSTKTVAKKVNTKTATVAIKKDTVKKSTAKKSTVAKKASTAKKKTSTTKKVATKTSTIKPLAEVVEYYDLPYRYNETIVKILYQTPDTLFVYWDIADSDREKYIKQYGENFFNITRPVFRGVETRAIDGGRLDLGLSL